MRKLVLSSLVAVAWLAFLALPSAAQTPTETTAAAASPPKGSDVMIGDVEVHANWRTRFEIWDWFDTSLADGDYTFGASVLRLGLSQKRKSVDWQFEVEQPTLLGLPTNATAPAPQGALGLGANYFESNGENAASVFVKQAFIRIKNLGAKGNSLRLGRFDFIEGNERTTQNATLNQLKSSRIAQRLIGTFSFAHVGRSFDGAQFVSETSAGNLTLMGGRATRGVFHVGGMPELDTDIAYAGFTRASSKSDTGEFRIFVIGYHDGRRTVKADNRPLAVRSADTGNISIGTYGGHVIQTFKADKGTVDLLAWGAWQNGSWGSLDHKAWALALEGGYQFPLAWKPWLRVGWSRSSGDSNPEDSEHGTFFQILPTPRIYARFPFYNLMNNEDLFAELILKPHKKLVMRADVHGLRLGETTDLWYAGGGAFETTTFGYAGRPSGGSRSLATAFDMSADFQINQYWSIGTYLADAEGGAVIRKIYPNGSASRFGYVEATLNF